MLFALHASLLGWQAYSDSPTWDEVGHFAAGVEHWRHGRFRLYRVNPPLVRIIALAPVALSNRDMDSDHYVADRDDAGRPEFMVGGYLAKDLGQRYFILMAMARWACIPFSLLGAWVCWRWARELWGAAAGWTALVLWVFSPSVLAWGHIITPDMGATGLGVAAAYLLRRWLLAPTVARALAAGLVLGLAELTKSTWVILVILWPVLWAVYRLLERPRPRVRQWMVQGAHLVMMMFTALWVVNLCYGFEGSFKPLREYRFVSEALSGNDQHGANGAFGNRFADTWLGGLPVPVPENYVLGIDFVKMEYERKYWSYLRGEWRFGGWWHYYLYAMLVKEPLGTWLLALLAVAAGALCRRTYRAPINEELLLAVPVIVVLALVSSQTGFNHHLRYVLPVYPFAFIWMSRLGRALAARHWVIAAAGAAALGWSVISSLSVAPHSLSYFNELAGGPKRGYWHLGNSNADWGQDLLHLKKWYDQTPQARPLYLAYGLPLVDPMALGIDWREVPYGPTWVHAKSWKAEKLGPCPGWFAVSVNELTSRDHKYDYFNDLEPVAWAGYSLPIYHVTVEQANALRRRYGMPEVPLNAAPTTREAHHASGDDSRP